MALVNPHPALKVAVPMNPMVDGWMGDDWFHNGAFREQNMAYIYEQEATRGNDEKCGPIILTTTTFSWNPSRRENSAAATDSTKSDSGANFLSNPSYDSWWQQQAMDRILASQPLKVPTMLVDSLWDQEDIYGAPAVYKALKAKDPTAINYFLVLGPWHHGQEIGNASSLERLKFNSDTGSISGRKILRPFLDKY